MSIEAFRTQWTLKKFGCKNHMQLTIREQNELAKDYANHMMQSERMSWRIVFAVLIVFYFVYHYAG